MLPSFPEFTMFSFILFNIHLNIGCTFILSDFRKPMPSQVVLSIFRGNLNWCSLFTVVNLCFVNSSYWITASLYFIAVPRPLHPNLDMYHAFYWYTTLLVLPLFRTDQFPCCRDPLIFFKFLFQWSLEIAKNLLVSKYLFRAKYLPFNMWESLSLYYSKYLFFSPQLSLYRVHSEHETLLCLNKIPIKVLPFKRTSPPKIYSSFLH